MSRVAHLTPPTVATGDDYVNARALDAALALIVDKVNELLAALTTYGADNELADGSIYWRSLLGTLQQQLDDMMTYLALLYQRVPVRWVNWPSANGGPYTDLGGGWASGLVTSPSSWSVALPGDPEAFYLMRLHLRGVLSPIATLTVGVGADVRTIDMTTQPLDTIVAFKIRGGQTLSIALTPGSHFTSQTFEPAANAFAYRPRYRGIGFQFDWLCYEPIEVGAIVDAADERPLIALDGTTLIGWL